MNKVIGFVVAAALLVPAASALADVDITLNGGAVTVQQGQAYVEPGYSADSTVDGDITSSVVVSNPGTSNAGNFVVTYSVTDSTLTTATASRGLRVIGSAGTQPFCSSPTAPGWRADLPDGGCGHGVMKVLAPGTPGCAFFNVMGCVIKE